MSKQVLRKRYADALMEAKKAGAAITTGDAHLAQTCEMLSGVHAINPALVYHGAKSRCARCARRKGCYSVNSPTSSDCNGT